MYLVKMGNKFLFCHNNRYTIVITKKAGTKKEEKKELKLLDGKNKKNWGKK